MGRKRSLRQLVRDREQLAAMSRGGSSEHPIEVTSAAVVEVRTGALPCPQCGGEYRIAEHRSVGGGLRCVDVVCRQCGVPRTLWFRLVSVDPN